MPKNAKVISFMSTKGSVGKTTLCIHIAGYLASLNKKVLLIDADSQQSLSQFFDYTLDPFFLSNEHVTDIANGPNKISQNGFGLFFTEKRPYTELIYKTANHKNIDVIPNDDPDKLLVQKYLRNNTGSVYKLPILLKPLKEIYDYIFIDTEGTDGRDHDGNSIQNAALLAEPDLVISVTKTKIQFAMEILRVVDVYNDAVKTYSYISKDVKPPLVFIINEHDRYLNIAQSLLTEIKQTFREDKNFANSKLIETIVPLKKAFFEKYYNQKQFMHEYKDTTKYDHLNVVIKSLCEELFPEIVADDVKEVSHGNA